MRRTAAGLVLLVTAAGCNDDGRTLGPAPEVPDVPLTTSTTAATGSDGTLEAGLAVRSPGLADGATIPAEFTCDGRDVHPPLAITGIPAAAAELAITVVDLDADGYVHWVVAGLPATTSHLDAGTLPAQAVEARATDGSLGWVGPCPPAGDGAHRYEFSVYAMVEPVGMSPGLDGDEAIDILASAATDVGRYTLRYARQP